MVVRLPSCRAVSFACLLAAVGAAQAADSQTMPGPATQQSPSPGGAPASTAPQPSPGEPGFGAQLFDPSRTNLLGDLYGLRPALGSLGVALGLTETSEVLGNATGGVRRSASYAGVTTMSLGVDTDAAFGWAGGTFNVSAFQIHGRNISQDNLLILQTASGIQAQRATRLWELWYQQEFLGGKLDVKLGQQSLDQEFLTSAGSSVFINTAAGWPLVPSVDLYAGGPAYPLASLGVRVRGQPMENVTILAGVFDDNPPGGRFYNDSQVRGGAQSGTAFHVGTGALAIAEVKYVLNPPPTEKDQPATGLPGVYKLGGWYDSGHFPDQRVGTDGLSLADADSNGNPRFRRNNWSLYGVFDQTVWRPAPDAAQAVSVFGRLMGAPSDRNLASFSLNAGITLKAPLPGRDNDTIGFEYGLAKIGNRAILLDQDRAALANGAFPIRSSESFIELTYQAQIAPWLAIQPDIQYIWTPGGGTPNPNNANKRIGNEAIFGVRSNVTF